MVNVRKEKCDVKIGRNGKGDVAPIPEAGCFGNPYRVDEYGRDGSLVLYQDYFNKRIEEDGEFREAIRGLKGQKLGCFCKPVEGFNGKLMCHGQIIAAWLDEVLPTDIS